MVPVNKLDKIDQQTVLKASMLTVRHREDIKMLKLVLGICP